MSNEFTDVVIDNINLDDPNLQSWDGKTRQLFPEGEFVFEATNATVGASKAGNNTLCIEWKAVSEGDAFGLTLRSWYGLGQTDNANSNRVQRARLKHVFIDCLGVNMLAGGSFTTGDVLGRRLIAEVSHETKREFSTTHNAEIDITRERMHSERAYEDLEAQKKPAQQAAPAQPPPTETKTNGKGSRQAVGAVAQARK